MPENGGNENAFLYQLNEAMVNSVAQMAVLVQDKLDLEKQRLRLQESTSRLSLFQTALRGLRSHAELYFQGRSIMTEVWFFVRNLELNATGAIMRMDGYWASEALSDQEAVMEAIVSCSPGRRNNFTVPIIGSVTNAVQQECPRCRRSAPVVGRRDLMKWDLDDSDFTEAAYVMCLDCLRLAKIAETVTAHRS